MAFARLLFRIRGYIPVPFILAALIWAEFRPVHIAVGIVLAISGECLRIVSIRYAGGATRTRIVFATSLVTSGPFAHSRNPLYLANMLIYTGFALASGGFSPYLPIIVFVYFGFQYAMIIMLEEQTLGKLFGDEYDDYCRNVPRLLPIVIPKVGTGKPDLSLRDALQQERRTLQGFSIVWLLLVLRLIL